MLLELAATTMGEIMHADPDCVPIGLSLGAAVNKMKGKYGALLVEKKGTPIGIFTERDLMKRIDHSRDDWKTTPIGEVMTRSMRTLGVNDTISDAIALMSRGIFRHVPIIDDGKVVGIVSIRDILMYAVEHYPKEFINLPPSPDSEASGPWGG